MFLPEEYFWIMRKNTEVKKTFWKSNIIVNVDLFEVVVCTKLCSGNLNLNNKTF